MNEKAPYHQDPEDFVEFELEGVDEYIPGPDNTTTTLDPEIRFPAGQTLSDLPDARVSQPREDGTGKDAENGISQDPGESGDGGNEQSMIHSGKHGGHDPEEGESEQDAPVLNELLTDYTGPAIRIAENGDTQLITITGQAGQYDGERYFNIEGSNTAVSEDEIILAQDVAEGHGATATPESVRDDEAEPAIPDDYRGSVTWGNRRTCVVGLAGEKGEDGQRHFYIEGRFDPVSESELSLTLLPENRAEKNLKVRSSSANRAKSEFMQIRDEALESMFGERPSQDAVLANEELGVYGVFDGLGGGPAGDVASQTAARAVETTAQALDAPTHRYNNKAETASLLKKANEGLAEAAEQDPSLSGMATTGVVLRRFRSEAGHEYAAFANVGDCSLALIREGRLQWLTYEECDPWQPNVVTNVLSSEHSFKVDERNAGTIGLRSGDRLVLMSDGITGDLEKDRLTDDEYLQALDPRYDTDEAVQRLIESSKKIDDKGVVVLDVAQAA